VSNCLAMVMSVPLATSDLEGFSGILKDGVVVNVRVLRGFARSLSLRGCCICLTVLRIERESIYVVAGGSRGIYIHEMYRWGNAQRTSWTSRRLSFSLSACRCTMAITGCEELVACF